MDFFFAAMLLLSLRCFTKGHSHSNVHSHFICFAIWTVNERQRRSLHVDSCTGQEQERKVDKVVKTICFPFFRYFLTVCTQTTTSETSGNRVCIPVSLSLRLFGNEAQLIVLPS